MDRADLFYVHLDESSADVNDGRRGLLLGQIRYSEAAQRWVPDERLATRLGLRGWRGRGATDSLAALKERIAGAFEALEEHGGSAPPWIGGQLGPGGQVAATRKQRRSPAGHGWTESGRRFNASLLPGSRPGSGAAPRPASGEGGSGGSGAVVPARPARKAA